MDETASKLWWRKWPIYVGCVAFVTWHTWQVTDFRPHTLGTWLSFLFGTSIIGLCIILALSAALNFIESKSESVFAHKISAGVWTIFVILLWQGMQTHESLGVDDEHRVVLRTVKWFGYSRKERRIELSEAAEWTQSNDKSSYSNDD